MVRRRFSRIPHEPDYLLEKLVRMVMDVHMRSDRQQQMTMFCSSQLWSMYSRFPM